MIQTEEEKGRTHTAIARFLKKIEKTGAGSDEDKIGDVIDDETLEDFAHKSGLAKYPALAEA